MLGGRGQRGKNWDNYNSIINKNFFLNQKFRKRSSNFKGINQHHIMTIQYD